MIKIAVCDDEEKICEQMENILLSIFEHLSAKCIIDLFFTGEELCLELRKQSYDLIFLDIELKKMNGVSVGKFIRDTLKNEITQIIYISSNQHYAMELFQCRPFDFVTKPLTYQRLDELIRKYISISKRGELFFSYKIGFDTYKVPYQDIVFFEKIERKIYIHFTSGEIQAFYGTMDDVCQRIHSKYFLLIHKSYLVNFNYIKVFKHNEIKLIDNTTLTISQTKRKSILKQYDELVEEVL